MAKFFFEKNRLKTFIKKGRRPQKKRKKEDGLKKKGRLTNQPKST